ncbi:hypothetical protein DM02DRAFT_674930 [Periconia macrospinosa]|uniref:Uncharacterized protein n=1 Tax=Periconia macrospinosa TaxID=97972 RepID=A0A2V1DFA4_9PLEO|nr:hypothetical protein DM02DRAFT_674930 [Periconia macrospinosa]
MASQRQRKNFEDCVDEDHPVKIDYTVQSWWIGKFVQYLCWEVKGQVGEDYKVLEPKIYEEFGASPLLRESNWKPLVWPYMIGKSPRKAKPIIVISSEDEASRNEAKKVIELSDFFKNYQYFELLPLRYLPSGRVYFDPDERLRTIGMPTYIKHSETSVRPATANAVYNGDGYGYITAAHAFPDVVSDAKPPLDTQETFDLPFNSDSDSDDEAQMETLSQYSRTPPESSDSEHLSFRSSVTSGPRDQSPRINDTQQHILVPPMSSDRSSMNTDMPTNTDTHPVDHVPIDRLEPLGTVSPTSTVHDCVVVSVTHPRVIDFLTEVRSSRQDVDATIAVAQAQRANITAITSRGSVHGYLFDLPLYMSFTNSNSLQLVYKFIYDGVIQMGDCGTLVIDSETKEVYGHVVAASENTQVAFITAAGPVMNDIQKGGDWRLLCLRDTGVAEFPVTPTRSIPEIQSQHFKDIGSSALMHQQSYPQDFFEGDVVWVLKESDKPPYKATIIEARKFGNEWKYRCRDDKMHFWVEGFEWIKATNIRKAT